MSDDERYGPIRERDDTTIAGLRAEIARVTAERDEARRKLENWFGGIKPGAAFRDALVRVLGVVFGATDEEIVDRAELVRRERSTFRADAWPGDGEKWTLEPAEVEGEYVLGHADGSRLIETTFRYEDGSFSFSPKLKGGWRRWPRPLPEMPPVPEDS